MKKYLLILIALITVTSFSGFAQITNYIKAPNGVTTTQVRAPNGLSNYAYLRACALVLQSELTGISPANNTVTAFGYTLQSGTNVPCTGNFTVYLQNTSDVSYTKGTTWSSIITGMTQVYASTMTVPASAGTTSVSLTLATPFVYTGGGIYVAYDWYSAGPYASTPATYYAEGSTLVPGCASANSATSSPTTLGTTAFRPNFLFGTPNPYSNEVSVNTIDAIGRLAGSLTTTNLVSSQIRNNSNQTLNNIPVSLNITGANTYANTQTVSTLAAGATTTVVFPVVTPTLSGINTLSVSVPSDQLNSNNSQTYTQSITCNEWALNPSNVSYTLGSIGFNTGSGIIASTYTNPVASTLNGIKASISTNTPAIGNQIWGALIDPTGSVVATTNTLTISNAMLGTQASFSFSTPPSLLANTVYYLGVAQPANTLGYFPVGSYTTAYVQYTNYVTTTTVGGTPAPLTSNLGYLDIVGVFAPMAQTVTLSSPTLVCGTSATLTNSAFNYTWAGGPTNSNYVVTPTATSNYSLNYSDSYGCAGSATTTVNVTPITVNASGAATICSGSTVSLNASGGATGYNWSSGQSGTLISVSPTITTNYLVTGTTSAGCSNTAAVSVSVNANPTVTANSSSSIICVGQSATITAAGANTYTWNTSAATNTIAVSPTTTTTYTVTGFDANGCFAFTAVTQSVSACTGINNITGVSSGIEVYPNPNNGIFYIQISSEAQVEIMDVLGKTLLTKKLDSGKYDINVSDYADGIYYVSVKSSGIFKTIKVVKQ